mmetsp:Transcript_12798/g.19272  ORF Transcript_12798/g.19272 Transcript_12798/m.19272 type:complete len:402 (-) Transcript_12798:1280-2485(-)
MSLLYINYLLNYLLEFLQDKHTLLNTWNTRMLRLPSRSLLHTVEVARMDLNIDALLDMMYKRMLLLSSKFLLDMLQDLLQYYYIETLLDTFCNELQILVNKFLVDNQSNCILLTFYKRILLDMVCMMIDLNSSRSLVDMVLHLLLDSLGSKILGHKLYIPRILQMIQILKHMFLVLHLPCHSSFLLDKLYMLLRFLVSSIPLDIKWASVILLDMNTLLDMCNMYCFLEVSIPLMHNRMMLYLYTISLVDMVNIYRRLMASSSLLDNLLVFLLDSHILALLDMLYMNLILLFLRILRYTSLVALMSMDIHVLLDRLYMILPFLLSMFLLHMLKKFHLLDMLLLVGMVYIQRSVLLLFCILLHSLSIVFYCGDGLCFLRHNLLVHLLDHYIVVLVGMCCIVLR